MDDLYKDKMQYMENECLSWIRKANDEVIRNRGRHTKEEIIYLQNAARIRSDMANASKGAEKSNMNMRVMELNERIREAILEVDPQYFTRLAEKQKSGGGKSGAAAPAAKQNGDTKDEDNVDDWLRPIPKTSFDEVTGMEEVVKKLKGWIDFSKMDALKDFLGVRKDKAYFFIGPPGCGKTFIVKAFVHELAGEDYKYLYLDSADILSKYVGDAEKTIAKLFRIAAEIAPCVIFIDEIDGVCKNRALPNLPEYASSITTAFLTGYNQMIDSGKPIILIGATNYPGNVDSAMLDRVEIVEVSYPDKAAREKKFEEELTNHHGESGGCLPLLGGLNYTKMAELTENQKYNYRDMERLCEELKLTLLNEALSKFGGESAALDALKSGRFGISPEMFERVHKKCPASPKKDVDDNLTKFKKTKYYHSDDAAEV